MSHLRDVIAAAIWRGAVRRRLVADLWDWDDLRRVDRQEFEADADSVLEALRDEGLLVTGHGPADGDDRVIGATNDDN